ncbi:MAG: lysylphosphatidylglycerol synthase transmembrane domain-containing protein [Lentisphaeria bacterium]|jgi:uncharacterized protein (TIRG00374 family)|nr:lysylphosphatidylglycerol synthase transmembrane domain-containing protein [Lentisphaeria bacterium]
MEQPSTPAFDPAAPRPHAALKRLVLRLAGIAIAVGLLYATLRGTDADFLGSLKGASWPMLFLAFLCISNSHFVGAWRWGCLLLVQGIRLPFLQLLRLTLIGVFFSAVIPGTVSGDVIKMAYATRAAPQKGMEAAFTVALDRLIGLAGLFAVAVLASLAMLWRYPQLLSEHPVVSLGLLAVWAGAAAFAGAYLAIMARTWVMRHQTVRSVANRLAAWLPPRLLRLILKMVAAVDLYKSNQAILLKTLLQSMFVHAMLGVAVFLVGRAFREQAMTLLQYMLATQVGNATGVIPLTPGGIGLREAVTAALFTAFEAQPATIVATIPIANTIIATVWTLVGAAAWVFKSNPATTKTPSARAHPKPK